MSDIVAISFNRVNNNQDIEITITSTETVSTITIKNGPFNKALAYPTSQVVGTMKTVIKTPESA